MDEIEHLKRENLALRLQLLDEQATANRLEAQLIEAARVALAAQWVALPPLAPIEPSRPADAPDLHPDQAAHVEALAAMIPDVQPPKEGDA